jgi:hypothetical protein
MKEQKKIIRKIAAVSEKREKSNGMPYLETINPIKIKIRFYYIQPN